jgi:hypothetical protein
MQLQQFRKARHDNIAAYAAEMAGTDLDLDAALESAGVAHLLKSDRRLRRSERPTAGGEDLG